MILNIGIDTNFAKQVLIQSLSSTTSPNLSKTLLYALKKGMQHYLEKNCELEIKNNIFLDTSLECISDISLTHGFGFNMLDRDLHFSLSATIKLNTKEPVTIEINPAIQGVRSLFFPVNEHHYFDDGCPLEPKEPFVKVDGYYRYTGIADRAAARELLQWFASPYHPIEYTEVEKLHSSQKELKTQTNIKIRQMRFSCSMPDLLSEISCELREKWDNTLVPEGCYLCDYDIFRCRHEEMTYINLLSGQRYTCSCSEEFHAHLLATNPETIHSDGYFALSDIASLPRLNRICHICIIKEHGIEESIKRYGAPDENLHYFFEAQASFYRHEKEWAWIYENLEYSLGITKWVNENKVFLLAKDVLPQLKIYREASPSWLGSQRLDVFFPEISLAIEYQGKQHFEPIDFFGGEEAFKKNQERDSRKSRLCEENGVSLIYVNYTEKVTMSLMKRKLRRFAK